MWLSYPASTRIGLALVLAFFTLVGCQAPRKKAETQRRLAPQAASIVQNESTPTEAATPPPRPDYFTLGSTPDDVAAVMGTPTAVHDYGILGIQWNYGSSSVTFKNGRVAEWSNYSNNLRVRVGNDHPSLPPQASIGDSTNAPGTVSIAASPAASPSFPAASSSSYTPTSASSSPYYGGSTSSSYQRVSGYTRKDGTYVAPHYRTKADSSRSNNWSSRGNVNPFTGKRGYR